MSLLRRNTSKYQKRFLCSPRPDSEVETALASVNLESLGWSCGSFQGISSTPKALRNVRSKSLVINTSVRGPRNLTAAVPLYYTQKLNVSIAS